MSDQHPPIAPECHARITRKLVTLYGKNAGQTAAIRLMEKLEKFPARNETKPLDESDAILIAYGDHIQQRGTAPLAALHGFMQKYLAGSIKNVHLLPFFPYSSDDGFSVIDYMAVNPKLGDWKDIEKFSEDFGLMFDFVLNHISSRSEWFEAFRRGDPRYQHFFITEDPDADLSKVYRPRTLPLLSPVDTPTGMQYVWTTFGPDQIDLNYAEPDVLLAMIDVLLQYVSKGARFIRMDAVTYIRKVHGTNCVHLPETHMTVQLFRDVLEAVAPDVQIITETNVPHADNIAYFGDGRNEAHAVYNFALPPLLLHTLHTGDSTALSHWAKTLRLPSDKTYFFNFTASHDGIGVTPVKNILSDEEITALIDRAKQYGSLVGERSVGDGVYEPYELNTTYYNALSAHNDPLAHERFMVSQAIMLALKGVPGIYLGSLLGNKNWYDGVEKGGYNRAINRQKLEIGTGLLPEELLRPDSERGAIFTAYQQLLKVRGREPAFHPGADMEVLTSTPDIFAIRRSNGESTVLAVHSVADAQSKLQLPPGTYCDLLNGRSVETEIELMPYQIVWLKLEP